MDVQLDDESPGTGDAHGLRVVRELLEAHPRAAVAVVDVAKNLGDARQLLAELGVDIGTHTTLRGTVAAQFVTPADAWMVSDAIGEAHAHGVGTRDVELKDGRNATLHLVTVDEPQLSTGFVMVIVPHSDGTFADTQAANASEAVARVGLVHADGSGCVTRADDSVLGMLGWARVEIEQRPVVSIVHPDDQGTAIVHWVAGKEQRGIAQRWRGRIARGDGSFLWSELTLTNRINELGEGDVRIEIHDISREVAAAEALAKERSLLKQLTETLPVGVAKFDSEGRIEYANAQLTTLLGRDPGAVIAEAIAGEAPGLAEAFSHLLRDGRSTRFVSDRVRAQPDLDLEWTLQPVTSEAGAVTGGVLCVADVTEATALRAALEERAATDSLTGCFNRAGIVDFLQVALTAAVPGVGIGLLFIDLDGFKGINDGHGHAVGDRVLEVVAQRLRNAVRPPDMIGRLGGDEFVVMAPGLMSIEVARTLATRVAAEVNGVATIADLRVDISASIGVAWADSGNADELLDQADRAMYSAKCAAA